MTNPIPNPGKCAPSPRAGNLGGTASVVPLFIRNVAPKRSCWGSPVVAGETPRRAFEDRDIARTPIRPQWATSSCGVADEGMLGGRDVTRKIVSPLTQQGIATPDSPIGVDRLQSATLQSDGEDSACTRIEHPLDTGRTERPLPQETSPSPEGSR